MHIWQARFWRRALSPYSIYRHYPVLHAVRVGLAYLLTVALVLGFDIPHGEWMSITVLIVMGSLPHLGSIFKKARQRAIGTAAGALAGILLIALFTKVAWLGYVLLVLAAAICGYLAIGPAGLHRPDCRRDADHHRRTGQHRHARCAVAFGQYLCRRHRGADLCPPAAAAGHRPLALPAGRQPA
ncbi:FUSC family protein [Laribacter hongkongensis]|uniref:FUSC family protein n=1 Tax=Laribacter hongkongensis TaxID=168471 RepID=UPI0009D64187|nr:FUSC family protein [Laribacter hongkongensis]